MYILFSVDHFSIFSKFLERAWVKDVILFQFALTDRVLSSAYISVVELFKCKAYHSQIWEIKLNRGLTSPAPLAWQVSARLLYALVSQTVITLPDTIETSPRYLGWRCTLIISLVVLWLITSSALRKSTNTSPVTSSLPIINKIPSVIMIRAVSVEWPERKAHYNSYSKLFSWRYSNSEFATCFSMILDRIGSTEMGQ